LISPFLPPAPSSGIRILESFKLEPLNPTRRPRSDIIALAHDDAALSFQKHSAQAINAATAIDEAHRQMDKSEARELHAQDIGAGHFHAGIPTLLRCRTDSHLGSRSRVSAMACARRAATTAAAATSPAPIVTTLARTRARLRLVKKRNMVIPQPQRQNA
jgi:hypothetical protein